MGSNELQRFIDNKSLVALKKFAKAEAKMKELKTKHDEVIEQVKQAMINNSIQNIKGDWGSITLAERVTYTATDITAVPNNFTKQVLDPVKIKAVAVLANELPEGVKEVKTQYITKRFKEI